MNTSQGAPRIHDEAFELIPWLVNGRISRSEQEWLERHLSECEECRREVAVQHRLRRAIRCNESNIEYAPHASFQRLWSQIEASERSAAPVDGIDRGMDPGRSMLEAHRATLPPQRWLVAAATLLAVGLGLVMAMTWRAQSPGRAADYRTATAPQTQRDREGQIRAVFAPSVTVDELTHIVSETRLSIVEGPSDAGVYTLAVQPGQDLAVAAALERLRRDPRVRFAEPVVAPSRGPP
jgi:anti-sigma factor RsiW